MSADSSELLRMLGVGAAAKTQPRATQASRPPGVENAEFADLLAQVESGGIASGLKVSIDRDAGVSLTDGELAALSVAADKAEAAGIRRAVVMKGGEAMILDVHTRTIVGKAEIKDGVLAGIDGVIRLDGAGAADVSLPVPSGFMASNPSLAAAIEVRKGGKG
jgi:hypothetical protein